MLKNKRILITGATGFIGYHLVKKLCTDNNIFCIVRDGSDLTRLNLLNNITFVYYDGSLFGLKQQIMELSIDITYHLASMFVAEHQSSQVDNLIFSNVLFPTQLLEVLSECGFNKLINTGTSWQTYSEIDSSPVCLYAATKQAFEGVIKYYVAAKNMSCINLILYDTYGPEDGRKKLFWLLNNARITGEVLKMSLGEQRLNLVYIDDVVNGFIIAGKILLDAEYPINETYGIYDNIDYSLREVVKTYEEVYGVSLNIVWGIRPYRSREVMVPHYKYALITGLEDSMLSLKRGLELLASQVHHF